MQRLLASKKTVGAGRVVRTTSFQLESNIRNLEYSVLVILNNSEYGEYKSCFGEQGDIVLADPL
jgi:hypothetical protein